MNIKPLQSLYAGFGINDPVGNNAFSYEQRQNKSIYVPSLIQGTLADLVPGEKIVFSEIEDGIEKNRSGLKNFIYYPFQGKDIFIFDNHNHAFFFWLAAYQQGKIKPGLPLVHIDQHTDMRVPQAWPGFSLDSDLDITELFDYTNQILNVGNFIQPALRLKLFSDLRIIDSSTTFTLDFPTPFVLDIDMDIFSNDMAYIDENLKITRIRKYIEKTHFITIATSPFFTNQEEAILMIRRLFL